MCAFTTHLKIVGIPALNIIIKMLTWEAQGRFKLPTSRFVPRLYSVELLGFPFQPIKFHEKRKELIGVEDGLAPSTSCIYNRRSYY